MEDTNSTKPVKMDYGTRVGATPSELLGGSKGVKVATKEKPAASTEPAATSEEKPEIKSPESGAAPVAETTPSKEGESASTGDTAVEKPTSETPLKPGTSEPTGSAGDESEEFSLTDVMVDALVSANYLPTGVDASSFKSEDDFMRAVGSYAIDPIRQQEREALEQQYLAAGIDPERVAAVRMRTMGLTPEQVQRANDMQTLHAWEPQEGKEDEFNFSYNYWYYKTKDLSDAEAERLAKNDAAADNVGAIIDERRAYFGEEHARVEAQNAAAMAEHSKKDAERATAHRKKVDALLKSGEIGGERYTEAQLKQLRQAVLNPTEVVEVGGKTKRTTKYQKMLSELMSTPEGELEIAARLLFRTPIQVQAEQNDRKESNGLLGKLNKSLPRVAQPRNQASNPEAPKSYGTLVKG